MKTVYLITSNPWKVASFSRILSEKNLDIHIEMLNEEYPENKELWTTEWVVLDGARYCTDKFQKPVLVQDTWLFIDSLNGFPWVNTKFVLNKIWNEWLLKLMHWIEKRTCQRVFSLWFCQPAKEPVSFTGIVNGTIASSLRGNQWFGFDPLFIPDWHEETFGENTDLRDSVSPFNETIEQFVDYWNK